MPSKRVTEGHREGDSQQQLKTRAGLKGRVPWSWLVCFPYGWVLALTPTRLRGLTTSHAGFECSSLEPQPPQPQPPHPALLSDKPGRSVPCPSTLPCIPAPHSTHTPHPHLHNHRFLQLLHSGGVIDVWRDGEGFGVEGGGRTGSYCMRMLRAMLESSGRGPSHHHTFTLSPSYPLNLSLHPLPADPHHPGRSHAHPCPAAL